MFRFPYLGFPYGYPYYNYSNKYYYNKNIEGVAASHLPEEILKSIQCTFNVIDKNYGDFLELLIRIQNVHDTSLNSDLPFKNHIVKGFNDLKLQYK